MGSSVGSSDRRRERRLDRWSPESDSRDSTLEILVSAAVIRDGKVLLIREEAEPYRKQWVLPQGYPRTGERLRDTAAREVREELGLEVDIRQLLGVYEDFVDEARGRIHYVIVCFLARTRGDEAPRTSLEAIDSAWVDPESPIAAAPRVVQQMLADLAKLRLPRGGAVPQRGLAMHLDLGR